MRFKIVIATTVALGVAACGDREEAASNGIAADQGFSVENSTANDMTAIDAATADAAGMAEDAENNLLLSNAEGEDGNDAEDAAANAE